MRSAAFTIIFAICAGPVFAGELSLLGGYGATDDPVQKAGAYQLEYLEGLSEHFAVSLSYLNQGHFVEHHRDGNAVNLWVRTNKLHRQLSLAAGAGGVFYYDTIIPPPGTTPPSDFHGWGTMVNLAAKWYTENRWILELRGSWIRGGQSFDTLSVLAGLGYQLDAPPAPGPLASAPTQTGTTTDNELTVFGGETVVNIPLPEGRSRAICLEYRRGLWRYVELTAGALYEGRNSLIDRYGLTTQLWLAKPFLHDRIALGAGGGAYFAIDKRRGDTQDRNGDVFISEIVSLTGSFRLNPHWHIRATWDRIITSYNRDSDIFLGGIGYRF